MTSERTIETRFDRERARRNAAPKPEDQATPQQKLVRAAETGGFEAIVAAAQPAEPPKMVTPEEREAELRRSGTRDKPKAKRKPAQSPEPIKPERPLTLNEQYIAEHCRWRARGPGDYRAPLPYGRCLTEYDPLTDEPIGDGYRPDEEDDAW
jgi:hypothetical protein